MRAFLFQVYFQRDSPVILKMILWQQKFIQEQEIKAQQV